MGNAVITIHHPTSLDHGIPGMEAGKIVDSTNSMIRLEKREGTACGCGGFVQFKKKSATDDQNIYSELYCYVDYEGKNCGRYNWTKNDLNLTATHTWSDNSELTINIKY